jgi:hypothetical protein
VLAAALLGAALVAVEGAAVGAWLATEGTAVAGLEQAAKLSIAANPMASDRFIRTFRTPLNRLLALLL